MNGTNIKLSYKTLSTNISINFDKGYKINLRPYNENQVFSANETGSYFYSILTTSNIMIKFSTFHHLQTEYPIETDLLNELSHQDLLYSLKEYCWHGP